MKFHVYSTSPIDWSWEALKSVEQTRLDILKTDDRFRYVDPNQTLVDEFDAAWNNAQVEARDAGWEGDFRLGPVVFWMPDPDFNTFVFGFAWKQDNNGTTFTVSPRPLPWLENA